MHKWMSTRASHEVGWVQVGSMEWAKQNIDLLGVNAVAYLNLDSGVYGPDVLLLTILIRSQVLGLRSFTQQYTDACNNYLGTVY